MNSHIDYLTAIILTFVNFILSCMMSIKFGNSLANFFVVGNLHSAIIIFIVWITCVTFYVLCSVYTQTIINRHKLKDMVNAYTDVYEHYKNTGDLVLHDMSYLPIKEYNRKYNLRQQWHIRTLIFTCLTLILLVSYSFKSSMDDSTKKINNTIVQMQEQINKMKGEMNISDNSSYITENK